MSMDRRKTPPSAPGIRVETVAPQAVTVPIGRPIANTRAYVLDAGLQPVPLGGVGELYLGGEGLALGYWRQPERTEERFLESPALPGERLYRTGDRARLLPDGNLEFRGRDDQQIKLRGFRIELGEIELALTALAEIAEAAVVLRDDLPGGRGLVAYVVGRGEAELPMEALRQALADQLPAYMVPAGFVQLAALPLTPNGKVDRRWLAEQRPAARGAAARPGSHRALRPRRSWRGSSARSWESRRSERTLISSPWADTPSWPRSWSRGCGRPSGSSCRCGRSSSTRRSPAWPGRSRRRRAWRVPRRRSCGSIGSVAKRTCRCPSRSSGCGSSTSWKAARSTTCRSRCG